jgi:predicted nucleic-acid-binding protein
VIGLDTNVLLRLIVLDDAGQQARADAALHQRCTPDNPGFINVIVLCELVWVLESRYGYSRPDIAGAVEALAAMDEILVDAAPLVAIALHRFRTSRVGFADCLLGVANRAAGCDTTLTFDRDAAALPEFTAL